MEGGGERRGEAIEAIGRCARVGSVVEPPFYTKRELGRMDVKVLKKMARALDLNIKKCTSKGQLVDVVASSERIELKDDDDDGLDGENGEGGGEEGGGSGGAPAAPPAAVAVVKKNAKKKKEVANLDELLGAGLEDAGGKKRGGKKK